MKVVVLLAALLCVPSSLLAQSDPALAESRSGIEGMPISIESNDPYLENMKGLIKKNWAFPCVKDAATRYCEYKSASLVAEFGVLRDGRLAFAEVQTSSGLPIYDEHALKAIRLAPPFPPVPSALMAQVPTSSTGIAIRVKFVYHIETDVTQILLEIGRAHV